MTTSTPATSGAAEVDLDALVAELDLSPVPFRLAGRVYQVRRDMTMKESARYWDLAATKDDAACMQMLVGDEDGIALNEALESMPNRAMMLALEKIMVSAGVWERGEKKTGESPAS